MSSFAITPVRCCLAVYLCSYILQIKNFLYAITSTVRTVSDDLATSRKNLNELVDKVCDICSHT